MPPKLAGWIVLFAMMLAIVGAGAWLGVTSVTGLLTVSRSHVWDSAAQPHVQEIRGPHSISLLAHAKAGAEAARPVFEFLQSLGTPTPESPAPLTDNEIATLAGTYVFGIGVNQQIELTVEPRQGVSPMYSPLYPAGAPSVRIRFGEDKGSVVMTVSDPELVLTARRRQEPK